MPPRFSTFAASAVLLLVGGGGGRLALAQTLGDGWQFRRALTFKQVVSDAPGDNLAWVEFNANGKQQPDGADFRVTTANRTLVPLKLLQVPGDLDLVRLAFATKGDGPYYVWWGNPKPDKPAPELEIRRGVFLELLRRPPATTPFTAPATAPATVPATTPPAIAEPQMLTSFILPTLTFANNPLADQRQVTFHYSATFKIDTAITAQMQLSMSGTGTLEIDGRALPNRLGRPAQVTLAAGWHRLEIRQVKSTSPSLSLTWLRPGDKTMTPFPATLFAPAAHAAAGNLERADGSFAPEISYDPAAEATLAPGTFAPRYVFETVIPDTMRPTLLWSFGDGQTSTLRKASHIFLTPGIYPITLKLQPANGPAQETTLHLTIRDRLLERMPKPPVDAAATVRAVLNNYRLESLPAEDAFRGMQFFESSKDEDLQITWGRAWLTGRELRSIPLDEVVTRETLAIAALQFKKKQFLEAAQTFRLGAAKPIGMDARVNLMRQEVMTLCDAANNPQAAVSEARDWATRVVRTSQLQIRTTQVALAYALIATGDGQAAKAAIDAASAPAATLPSNRGGAAAPPPPPPTPTPTPIPPDVWRAKVEAALAKIDLDTTATLIDQWELADPPSLWSGASRIQRIRLISDQGRHLDAARIAQQHARANPDGPYAGELLFRAVEQYRLGGDPQGAAAALDRLLKNYPTSPFARQAR